MGKAQGRTSAQQTVLFKSVGTAVQVRDPGTGKLLRTLRHPGEVTAVGYYRKGRVLLTVSEETASGQVHLWDAATGELLRPPFRLCCRLPRSSR